ncbi:hypothetical protein AVEN_149197-1, partial [Araneus ventricosus]
MKICKCPDTFGHIVYDRTNVSVQTHGNVEWNSKLSDSADIQKADPTPPLQRLNKLQTCLPKQTYKVVFKTFFLSVFK